MQALVVDDSRATRRILKGLLTPLGFEATEAENGQVALDLIEASGEYDLVVIDWNMPVMNGIALIEAIRSDSRHAKMRLLVVSSRTEIDRIREALEAGADEFLMKPFTKESLLSKLELMDMRVE